MSWDWGDAVENQDQKNRINTRGTQSRGARFFEAVNNKLSSEVSFCIGPRTALAGWYYRSLSWQTLAGTAPSGGAVVPGTLVQGCPSWCEANADPTFLYFAVCHQPSYDCLAMPLLRVVQRRQELDTKSAIPG